MYTVNNIHKYENEHVNIMYYTLLNYRMKNNTMWILITCDSVRQHYHFITNKVYNAHEHY